MTFEKTSDTAYFMFGRFNPPTIGHGAVFKKLAEDAKQDHADAFVFVGSTQNTNKNPLNVYQKMDYINKLYGDLGIHFINTTTCELGKKKGPCTNPSFAIERLREVGYDSLVMYVGSDRIEDFQWIVKSNVRKGIKNPVQIVNKMPPRNSNNFVASMSATKIRQAARNGDIQMVRNGTGLSEENARKLMDDIRSAYSAPVHAPTKSRKKGRLSPVSISHNLSDRFYRAVSFTNNKRRGGKHHTSKK